MEENFIKYIEQSIKDHWDLPALTDFKGATSSYKDVARKIEKLHLLFEHCGIRKGDIHRSASIWNFLLHSDHPDQISPKYSPLFCFQFYNTLADVLLPV